MQRMNYVCVGRGSGSNDLSDQPVTAVREKDASGLGLESTSTVGTMDGSGAWFGGRVDRLC